MKRCSVCGRENMDHENFCSSCGNPLTQLQGTRSCPQCQNQVGIDDQFCDHCGNALPPYQPNSAGHWHGGANVTRPMEGAVPSPPSSQMPVGSQPGGFPPTVQSYSTPTTSNKNWKVFLLSFSITLIIGVAAALLYIFVFDKDETANSNPTPTTTQNTNGTSSNNQSTTTTNTKPKPPETNSQRGNSTNNSTTTNGLGYYEMARGSFTFPLNFYQTLDFERDGIIEFVVGVNDVGGHIEAYNWNGVNFTKVVYADFAEQILELNASHPRTNSQFVYIPASDYMLYSLETSDDGSFFYDGVDMVEQPLAVLDGYIDLDNEIDYIFMFERNGSKVISFRPSSDPTAEMEVGTNVFNLFLTDVDGDSISDLLYLENDAQVGNYVVFTIWDPDTQSYLVVGETSFGDNLLNYYPFDIDFDGVSEIITTHFIDDGSLETRVWKWDRQQVQFVAIDVFAVEHSTAYIASPVAGDFDGNGVVDIMLIITENDYEPDEFIMYTR